MLYNVWVMYIASSVMQPQLMKSTKVQTLGVRDIANDDIVCTWSNIMRIRIFCSDKMATTGISRTMVEAL